MYIAEVDGQLAGFGHAVPGEIAATYVDPEYVRRGIGTALVEHGVEMAKAGTSGTIRIEGTLNARPLYEKCGFKVVRETTARRNNVEIPSLIFEMRLDSGESD